MLGRWGLGKRERKRFRKCILSVIARSVKDKHTVNLLQHERHFWWHRAEIEHQFICFISDSLYRSYLEHWNDRPENTV